MMPRKDEREPFYRVDVPEAKGHGGRRRRRRHRRARAVRVPDGAHPGRDADPRQQRLGTGARSCRKDKKIVFVCAVGQRSALAAEMAAAAGLPADHLYTLDGGTEAWRKAGEPVET